MKVEVAVLGFRPNEPYGFCGRKATLNHASALVTLSLICQSTSEDMKLCFTVKAPGASWPGTQSAVFSGGSVGNRVLK